MKYNPGSSQPPSPLPKTKRQLAVSEQKKVVFPDSPPQDIPVQDKTIRKAVTYRNPPRFPDSPATELEVYVPKQIERRKLIIAMPYYCNGGMLQRHQKEWAQYPDEIRKEMTVIVVDDGSPENKAIDAVMPCDYDLQIYQILEDKPWNQTGARNLAMDRAPEGWVLVTDVDHLLNVKNACKLLELEVADKHYYIPSRKLADGTGYSMHPNTYYLQKSLYWEVGGCDEDFSGWYGSDATFRRAVAEKGTRVELKHIHTNLFGRTAIADASTVKWGRKDSAYHVSNNPELMQKKKSKIIEKPVNPLRFEWKRVL